MKNNYAFQNKYHVKSSIVLQIRLSDLLEDRFSYFLLYLVCRYMQFWLVDENVSLHIWKREEYFNRFGVGFFSQIIVHILI